MSGWLMVHRQLEDHKIWQDKPFARGQAWIDLLILASWKDNKFYKRGLEIHQPEGSVAVSMKGLSDRWGWSIGKVKRFLLYLENENQIKHQSDNVTTLIHIVKWKEYQGTETKTKRKRKPNGNQTKTIEEGKKGKEVKHKHGEFKNVLLTDSEEQKLKDKFNGSLAEKIKDMDEAIEMKGYKYKSHYLAILKWDRDKPKDNDIYSAEIYK